MFLYKMYTIIIGRPIYHFIETSNEGIDETNIIKQNVKLKICPNKTDVVYFEQNGPYYLVVAINHHYNKLHTIWVTVEIMESEKK